MASVTDKITDIRNAARPNSARAAGTRSTGGTSLACDNLSGWPTASKVHFVTYTVDSNSVPVPGTQLDCYGIVSGNTIGSFTVVDGNDLGNAVGDYVEMLPTAAWGQDLADALTNQHTRLGAHQGITTDTISVSSGTTLPAGDIGTADLAADAVTAAKLADASVFPANLTAGLSSSSWAWQSWTPSWTNLTLGNGVLEATYIQIGKTINFRIMLTLGTTTNISGAVSFSLPVTAAAYYGNVRSFIGGFELEDSGVSNYSGFVGIITSTTLGQFDLITANGATYHGFVGLSNTAPTGLGNGDFISGHGTYEAA